MKNINVDKRLKKFLKKHKAWKKFKKNVKIHDVAYGIEYDITSLNHSFDWVDTKEGHNYWSNLNIEYWNNKNG